MNTSNTLNWLFMKDGLDDFRDGLPPAVHGSDFLKVCAELLNINIELSFDPPHQKCMSVLQY